MLIRIHWKQIIGIVVFLLSQNAFAEAMTQINLTPNGDQLNVSWESFGQNWIANVTKDGYLGENIPLIQVSVTTGDEELLQILPNCYYRGVLTNNMGDVIPNTTVFLDTCDNNVYLKGFVAKDNEMYKVEANSESATGISMRLESTANNTSGIDEVDTGDNGWKKGGSGGALSPSTLIPRGSSPDKFPSIDVYVNPSYRIQVGEQNYIGRIIETFAAANTIYAQSNMKQLHLAAIVLLDEDISRADSQGNILHGMEKIRKYTVLPDSADISMVYTGGEFNMPDLWGWAEGGYACELQLAVNEGNNINTHKVGQAAHAIIDLPTLLQRAWIFGHESGHILGMNHVTDDPLANSSFQRDLALKDYVVGCQARTNMFRSCKYDAQTKKYLDFYKCQ
jgi:hypothetical protein